MASVDATPETGVLVKYRTTKDKNYIKVSFYSNEQWDDIYKSVKESGNRVIDRIEEYAKKAECKYAVDVYAVYSSDACAAIKGGNNLRGAVVGMAVWCSHGVERTHIDGLENTVKLLLAYTLDI